MAFVAAGMGVAGLMLAIVVASLVYNLALTRVALKLNPGLIASTRAARPTRADWKAVGLLSAPTMVSMLGERIGVLSDSLVLASVLGGAAATTLSLTQRLTSLGQLVLGSISNAVWPSLAEMNARGEREPFNVRIVEVTRLVGVMGVAGLAPIIAFNSLFLASWVGAANDGGRAIVVVASAIALLQSVTGIYGVALVSTGHVGRLATPSIISGVLNLALSLLLTYWLGIIGPILGTLLACISVQLWYYPLQLRRAFGTSPGKLARALALPIACGIPFTLGLIAVADAQAAPNLFLVIGEMGISALLFLVFAYRVILGPGDRHLWRARLIAPMMRRWGRPRPIPSPDDFPGPNPGSPLGPS